MIEIEKKFLIKEMPNLKNYEKHKICQGYLNVDSEPILRIRRYDNEYFLTYKFKVDIKSANGCTEYELPITKKAYDNLSKKVDGIMINKTRYKLPIQDNLMAEIDIFEKELEGLNIVEVEFPNEEKAINFKPLQWFGKEVTKDKKYRNSSLSQKFDTKKIN